MGMLSRLLSSFSGSNQRRSATSARTGTTRSSGGGLMGALKGAVKGFTGRTTR